MTHKHRRPHVKRLSLDALRQPDFVRIVNLLMQAPGRIGQAVRMASEGISWRLSCAEQAAEWGRAPYLQRLTVLIDAAVGMPVRMGDANPWSQRRGVRGGHIWVNSKTGAERYQVEQPGAHETGGDEAPAETKPAVQPIKPSDFHRPLQGRSKGKFNAMMAPAREVLAKKAAYGVIHSDEARHAITDAVTARSLAGADELADHEAMQAVRALTAIQEDIVERKKIGLPKPRPTGFEKELKHASELNKLSRQPVPDKLPGGRADNIPDSAFDPGALAAGTKQELEHTSDPAIAKEIAKDGLAEDPEMYDHDRRAVHPGKLRGGEKKPHVTETPLTEDEETRYSRGECHALTAAILSVIPNAEPWGLFDTRYDDEIKHSVTRLPNTETFVDARGAVQGKDGLESLKHNFMNSEHAEWRPLQESKVRSMVTGDKGRTIRQALPIAKKLLRHVESDSQVAT